MLDARGTNGHATTLTVSLPRFLGRPESPGEPTIDEWLFDFDVFVRQCGVPASGGVGGLPWWVCEGGSTICHPMRFVGTTGPGVSAAAGVWAAGDRDVAVRGVLFAGAVGG